MKINISGPIVPDSYAWIYDYFDEPCTNPKKVNDALADASENEEVTVIINSGGGSVYAASEIYYALKSHQGKVGAEIPSIAASAASFIAMAASDIAVAPTGQIMIHNASTYGVSGDYREMDKVSDRLKAVNASISKAYEIKTDLSKEEIKVMMDKETFLTADVAVEKGFADRVLFIDEEQDFVADKGTVLPKTVIDDMMKRMDNGEFKDHQNSLGAQETKDDENKGADIVNYEDIKNDHPEIFEKIKNEGRVEGTKEENDRIKNIDAIAQVGMEELINDAKYKDPVNAGELAIEILNKQKEVGQKHIKDVDDDAGDLDQVEGGSPENEKEEEEAQAAVEAAETLKNIFVEGGVL